MNSMLQRHCARYIYVIPDGLRELLSDISREVLRSQPEDMYTFIADYLDALMITRENARVAARLVQSLTEMATTTATFLEETGMSRKEIDNIVSAIQKTFKKSIDSEHPKEHTTGEVEEANIVSDILQEININHEQAELAAVIIQQAYKRFKERKEREKELMAGMIDWRVAARSAILLYRKTGVTNEEANRAATLIKAAYKGYYTRRLMKQVTTMKKEELASSVGTLPSTREREDEEEYEGDESDDRQKAVTINYDTVRPHVDFDTDSSKNAAMEYPERTRKRSSAISIAKDSIKYIFDSAFERIIRGSVIPEEVKIPEMDPEDYSVNQTTDKTFVSGDLADLTVPVGSQEFRVSEIKLKGQSQEFVEPVITEEHIEPLGGGAQEDTFQKGEDENIDVQGG